MAESAEVKGVIEVKGKSFTLPEGVQFVVVRAPVDIEPDTLDGLNLEDLVEDDLDVTKQIGIAYFTSEETGYVKVIPSKSYSFVEKPKEPKPPKVIRMERPPMIPPTGLKVAKLPYSIARPKMKKNKKKQLEAASEVSQKGKVHADDASPKKKSRSS